MIRSIATAAFCIASIWLVQSCKTPEPTCPPLGLRDSVGKTAEEERLSLQWLRITGKLDSAQADPSVRERLERSVHSMDSSANRYRDSMRLHGGALESVSGCIDWNATLRGNMVDQQGLITAWMRTMIDSNAVAVQWALGDTAKDSSQLHVLFQVPGANGGTLDSTGLHVGVRQVLR
ncbi:MAG: hypothetical protein IPN71_21470 [Fibrobacteres bacterium]|nr:hypothetical protein [Fibrobacterota bacterium]